MQRCYTLAGDLTVMLQITFVCDQYHWEEVPVFHSTNLLIERIDLFETHT